MKDGIYPNLMEEAILCDKTIKVIDGEKSIPIKSFRDDPSVYDKIHPNTEVVKNICSKLLGHSEKKIERTEDGLSYKLSDEGNYILSNDKLGYVAKLKKKRWKICWQVIVGILTLITSVFVILDFILDHRQKPLRNEPQGILKSQEQPTIPATSIAISDSILNLNGQDSTYTNKAKALQNSK